MLIMSNASIPQSVVASHFPNAGKEATPKIDTDGECLIIRRVLIKGKPYDIRIWREDENNAPIPVNEQSSFSEKTIRDVKAIAQQMFEQCSKFPQEPARFHFKYRQAPQKGVCWVQDLKYPQNKPIIMRQNHIAEGMLRIHHKFFNTQVTAWSSDPNEKLILVPNKVQKETVYSPSAKDKKEMPAPTPTQAASPPPQSASSAKKRYEDLDIPETMKKASQDFGNTGGTFLENVSLTDLRNYANSSNRSNSNLKKVYEIYEQIVVDPNKTGNEYQLMRDWLRHHQKAAYEQYLKLYTIYQKDSEGRTFEDWCQYYAAKAVAGFIQVNKSIDPLVQMLQTPEIDPVKITSPQKKSRCYTPNFLKRCFCRRRNRLTIPSINGVSQTRFSPQNILDFYNGAANDRGHALDDLINKKDDQFLENEHGWIQWAFPDSEPSSYHPTAPLLTEVITRAFHSNATLQQKLFSIFKRALRFYGLVIDEKSGVVSKGKNFNERSAIWLKANDHNHLRISRILRSLKALQAPVPGVASWSESFFRCLKTIQQEGPVINTQNFSYWQAVHPTL
jgi:hypothetical protein